MNSEVVIENLAGDVTEQDLAGLLAGHVKVEKLAIGVNNAAGDGTLAAFACVDCDSHGCDALLALNETVFHGRPLKIKVLRQRAAPGQRASFAGGAAPGGRPGRAGHLGGKSINTRKSSGRGR